MENSANHTPFTLESIKALIPNFLHAEQIRTPYEYRCYETVYKDTEQGRETSIYLKTAKGPEEEYVPRLPVVKASANDPVSAQDPCPVIEVSTGEHYLFYGNGKDGIYALHLNPRNGLAHIEGFGVCVARRPKWIGAAISQPYVVYNKETEYYYLFVTYGYTESDSNIRVGRSKSIKGPYIDVNNRDLANPEDFRGTTGFMMSSGYRFDDSVGRMAPSRPLVFQVEAKWFLVQEALTYTRKEQREKLYEVRELLWTSDGWPVMSPLGCKPVDSPMVAPKDLIGSYEFIKLTPTLPQGVYNSVVLSILDPTMQGVSSTRNSWAVPIPALAEGRTELGGSMRGSWRLLNLETLELTYANYTETYRISKGWDEERNQTTLVLTGKDTNGIACFAKKI